ncbi:MAG: RnfABCDGE type electron transport complex subunit B [Oscillospiraceae bacterium]|nr:RnfABCDGE type electron transport complex subunit B [Oscillospiraceae bacterium]
MNIMVLATTSVTVIGFLCAIMLAVASKVMSVETDERVVQVRQMLPGANCGACGFAGCDAYADAVVNDDAKTSLCIPGGNNVASEISAFMGVEADVIANQVAVVFCRGDSAAMASRMEYSGIKTCSAVKQLFGGQNSCVFGCLGFGDCAAACPEDAICIEDGLARIDRRKCIGCAICVATCPNKIISMDQNVATAAVLCKNTERGAVTRRKCSAGCIACTLCVRECPEDAITMENNRAVVDQTKCTSCGKCYEVCVPKCIRFTQVPVTVTAAE